MDNILGHWLITECVPNSSTDTKKGIEGTSFELTKTGEVKWYVEDSTVDLPLLHCDTYEVVSQNSRGHYLEKAFLRFGTYRGHILDFHVDTFKLDANELVMTKSLWLVRCKKLDTSEPGNSFLVPFTLLPALEDGYFSDLDIVAGNSKIFHVHSTILHLSAPELDWTLRPPPLTGLPEEVLGTTLHFLYAQCLPPGLSESTVKDILRLTAAIPELKSLRTLCNSYILHITLKNRILKLVAEIHGCVSHMTERFTQRSALNDPAKLCDAVNLSIKDTAVANAKLLLVCHIYNDMKSELTEGASQEVIRYLQSRGPIILRQLKSFLAGLSSALNGLDADKRSNLACYIVPEMEALIGTAIAMLGIVESAAEVMLKQSLKDLDEQKMAMSSLGQDLNRMLTTKEFMRFDCFLGRLMCVSEQLLHRRESFSSLSTINQIRSLTCTLDQLIAEFPVFLLRLEEFAGTLDLKFEWNESQFCFKVGTSKVCEMLRKLVEERDEVRPLMLYLCQLVDREEFTQTLVELNLLVSDAAAEENDKTDPATPSHCGYMLNLTESLCESPCATTNCLSRAAGGLLESRKDTDMVFEVVEGESVTKVAAHRVIVAARCDWFRRALLSGMQEDINRRIEVHNISPALFRLFLEYLYTGQLDVKPLTCQQLIEILILADCYEVDSLKRVCEDGLKKHLKEETVVELLDLADQLNALSLRAECIRYITDCQDVLDQDAFLELSMSLQGEVYDAVRLTTGACICRRPTRRKPDGKRGEPEGQEDDSLVQKITDATSQLQIRR